jgi:glutathione S-transferase
MASAPTETPTAAGLPKIKLYWLDQSRSQRILWLLEELKLPYELEIFHRNKQTRLAPPELKRVHALGKSPVLSITAADSTESALIAESGFITEYLLEHFGKDTTLVPKHWKDGQEGKVAGETESYMRYKYYLHYAEGSLMPLMVMSLIANTIKTSSVPFFIKPITNGIASKIHSGFLDPNFVSHFSFLEDQLKTSPESGSYICGPHLTGADMLLSFPLIAAKGRSPALSKEKYPTLWAYIERLDVEPGYKKAIEKIVELEGSFNASL